jgi:hypothetical protein
MPIFEVQLQRYLSARGTPHVYDWQGLSRRACTVGEKVFRQKISLSETKHALRDYRFQRPNTPDAAPLIAITFSMLLVKAAKDFRGLKGTVPEVIGFCVDHASNWNFALLKNDELARRSYLAALESRFRAIDEKPAPTAVPVILPPLTIPLLAGTDPISSMVASGEYCSLESEIVRLRFAPIRHNELDEAIRAVAALECASAPLTTNTIVKVLKLIDTDSILKRSRLEEGLEIIRGIALELKAEKDNGDLHASIDSLSNEQLPGFIACRVRFHPAEYYLALSRRTGEDGQPRTQNLFFR